MAEISTKVRLTVDTGVVGTPAVKKIAEEVEVTLSLSKDIPETSSKDGNGWKTFLAGLKTGTVSCSAFVNYTPDTGFISSEDLFGLYAENYASTSKGIRSFTIADTTVGSSTYSFSAIITSMEQPAPLSEGMQFTFNLQITGAVTATAVV